MVKEFINKLRGTVSSIKGDTTLYYPGCITQFSLKDVFDNYKTILYDLGIEFRTINELNCCGSPLLNAGYESDFKEIKEKNLNILKRNGITNIITNCPHCYDIFKNQYGVRVEHITQVLDRHKHKITAENGGEVSYHDPCLLARNNNIIKEPRGFLRRLGFSILEPSRTKENTFCCGAGSGVKQNSPKIANKIAKERLRQMESKRVLVSCPYCYAHFKENAPDRKKIIEISETIIEG